MQCQAGDGTRGGIYLRLGNSFATSGVVRKDRIGSWAPRTFHPGRDLQHVGSCTVFHGDRERPMALDDANQVPRLNIKTPRAADARGRGGIDHDSVFRPISRDALLKLGEGKLTDRYAKIPRRCPSEIRPPQPVP